MNLDPKFCTGCGRRLVEELKTRNGSRALWRNCPRTRGLVGAFLHNGHDMLLIGWRPMPYDPDTGKRINP